MNRNNANFNKQNTQPSAQTNPYYNSNSNMQGQNNMQGSAQTNPYMQTPNAGFNTTELLVGTLVGVAATYILTNENVQKTLFKSALSIGDILSGGLDEMKERFEDAKAEREAEKEA